MDIDISTSISPFKNDIKKRLEIEVENELNTEYSASSTEAQHKIIDKLRNSYQCSVNILNNIISCDCSFTDETNSYTQMIIENVNKKMETLMQNIITDYLSLSDVKQTLIDQIKEQLIKQISSVIGGG